MRYIVYCFGGHPDSGTDIYCKTGTYDGTGSQIRIDTGLASNKFFISWEYDNFGNMPSNASVYSGFEDNYSLNVAPNNTYNELTFPGAFSGSNYVAIGLTQLLLALTISGTLQARNTFIG